MIYVMLVACAVAAIALPIGLDLAKDRAKRKREADAYKSWFASKYPPTGTTEEQRNELMKGRWD